MRSDNAREGYTSHDQAHGSDMDEMHEPDLKAARRQSVKVPTGRSTGK